MGDSCRYVPVLRIFRHARRAPLTSLRGCLERLAELAYRASYTRFHAEYAVDAQGRLPASGAPRPAGGAARDPAAASAEGAASAPPSPPPSPPQQPPQQPPSPPRIPRFVDFQALEPPPAEPDNNSRVSEIGVALTSIRTTRSTRSTDGSTRSTDGRLSTIESPRVVSLAVPPPPLDPARQSHVRRLTGTCEEADEEAGGVGPESARGGPLSGVPESIAELSGVAAQRTPRGDSATATASATGKAKLSRKQAWKQAWRARRQAWRDAIEARSADARLNGPISPSEIVEHPLMVHSQIAAFLYAAIAEEGISEEEARDELDAICG